MNEDRKLAFIKECYHGNEAGHLSIFKKLSRCEDYYGKDICEIPKEHILPYIKTAAGKSSSTISTNLSTLNKYYRYCLDRGYDDALPVYISYAEVSSLHSLRRNMVASPKMMEEVLNSIFPGTDEGEYSNILRCLLWMMYSGIKIEDAGKVCVRDVNLKKMYISFNGCRYPIYNEAVSVFEFCLNSEVIMVKAPKGKYPRQRIHCDLLLRSFTVLDPIKLRNGVVKHVKLARSSGKCDIELTCQSVYKSGLFYRAYSKHDDSLAIDIDPFDCSTKAPKTTDLTFWHHRDLKRDYESWKTTFYK